MQKGKNGLGHEPSQPSQFIFMQRRETSNQTSISLTPNYTRMYLPFPFPLLDVTNKTLRFVPSIGQMPSMLGKTGQTGQSDKNNTFNVDQKTNQFRNSNRRMRIVELDGHLNINTSTKSIKFFKQRTQTRLSQLPRKWLCPTWKALGKFITSKTISSYTKNEATRAEPFFVYR